MGATSCCLQRGRVEAWVDAWEATMEWGTKKMLRRGMCLEDGQRRGTKTIVWTKD